MEQSNNSYAPLAAFLATVLFGGLNAIGVRYTVLELPPFWGAVLRFTPAALILFGAVAALRLPLPRGRALAGAALYGALNFGGSYAFIYVGLTHVKPGMGQVILALGPLFTLFFALLHRQEAFRWRSLAGALLALAGIALVFREQIQAHVPAFYLLAIILGAMCASEASVLVKTFPRSHPVTTNAVGMAAGAAVLAVMTFLFREPAALPARAATWAALAYLILIGSCAFFILTLYLLKRWPASRVAYVWVLFPFVSLTASALLADETLNPVLAAGAALVLAGVYVGAFSGAKRQPAAPLTQPEPQPLAPAPDEITP